MMRSTIVTPSGVVCSKKPRETMSEECAEAARRRREFSRSSGRLRSARILLCRQRIAARTADSPASAGDASTFSQSCWAARALAPRAMWAVTGFAARLTPFAGPACEVAAGTSRPAQRSVSAAVRRMGWDIGVRPPGTDERLVFGLGVPPLPEMPYVARFLRQPGWLREPRGFASRPRERFALVGEA